MGDGVAVLLLEDLLVNVAVHDGVVADDLVHLVTLLVLRGTVLAIVERVVVLLDTTLGPLSLFLVRSSLQLTLYIPHPGGHGLRDVELGGQEGLFRQVFVIHVIHLSLELV